MTTYAACLTPPGAAAIAVLAVRGPVALDIICQLIHPRSQASGGRAPPENSEAPESAMTLRGLTPPARLEEGRFLLARFGDEAADEVVVSVVRSEPVPWVEIHCHGGAEVVRMGLEALQRRGAKICSWQELEHRTSDNPLRAAALTALAEAPTVRTAAVLLDQLHGAFEQAVRDILAALDRDNTEDAGCRLGELARWCPVGRHLTKPWRVVIAGAPNVGKSSLANALAGYQRSVVSPVPGTTRDVVSAVIAVDGWPVELCDTAGQRLGAEALEEEGIRLAQDAAATADLCLWVLDGSEPPAWPESSASALRYLVNKVDLPAAWDFTTADAVRVSARTGEGVPELVPSIASWLVPEAPPAGGAVPFTPEVCAHVEAARTCLDTGKIAEARRLLSVVVA